MQEQWHQLGQPTVATALEALRQGLVITDFRLADNPIVQINPAFTQITGYAADEVLGRNCRFLQGPDTDQAAVARLGDAIARGRRITIELLNYRKDGGKFWNRIQLSPVHEDGELTYFVGLQTDITKERELLDSLRESGEFSRGIIDTSLDGIVALDEHGVIIEFNPAAQAMFGYSRAAALGIAGIEILVQPAAGGGQDGAMTAFFGGGRGLTIGIRVELPAIRRDGTTFPAEFSPVLSRMRGRPVLVLVVRDLGASRAAQAALRNADARAAFAIEAIGAAVWDWDARLSDEGEADFMTEQHRAMIGLPADAPGSLADWRARVFPTDEAMVGAAIDQVMAGKSDRFCVQYRIRHEDGRYRWIETRGRLARDSDGDPLHLTGLDLDITGRRELEFRALEDEQRLRDFIAATHDWLWSWDAEQTMTYVSDQLTAAIGWLPAELVGRKHLELVIADPTGDDLAGHFADLQTRKPFRDLVVTVRRKDGGEAYIRTSGNPVFGADGEFRGYRGVGSDLTAIRRQASEADRSARLAAIGTLAGGVAHDVNNCLVPILGLADLILMTAEPGSTLAEDVEQIRAAAERARGITAQISTFSRASNDAPRIVDVADLVRSELRTHQASLPPHLRLETVIASVGAVSLPPLAIERVLANLFTNAVDAMADRPGRIVVEVAGIDPADPALKAHDLATGAYVLLSVTDEGCGIPAAAIRRVLEPFFTTKPVGKGTGLGLSVIHGIVTAQGGALTIDSVVDAGTTIGVILPLHTAADPVPAAPDRSPAPLPALAAIR